MIAQRASKVRHLADFQILSMRALLRPLEAERKQQEPQIRGRFACINADDVLPLRWCVASVIGRQWIALQLVSFANGTSALPERCGLQAPLRLVICCPNAVEEEERGAFLSPIRVKVWEHYIHAGSVSHCGYAALVCLRR